MRKIAEKLMVLVLLAVIVMTATGCAIGTSVDNLLVAPLLTSTQNDIKVALDSISSTAVSLKYPLRGDEKSPIQIYDLDADGSDEAIVFYNAQDVSIYANMAILKHVDNEWVITGTVVGPGTEIEMVKVLRAYGTRTYAILIEWASTNSASHQLSVYHYQNDSIEIGFEGSCVNMITSDFDADGYVEFCYVSKNYDDNGFTVSFVENSNNIMDLLDTYSLNSEMIDCMALTIGNVDETRAIFVDEVLSDEVRATEIFTLDNGEFAPAQLPEDYSLDVLSRRTNSNLTCTSLYGSSMCFPSDTPPYEEINDRNAWTYWYAPSSDTIRFVAATYVDESYMFALRVPEEWLATVTVKQDEYEQRKYTIVRPLTGDIVFEVKVLAVGEDTTRYVDEGFSMFKTTGAYRFYYRSNCDLRDTNYIINSFEIIYK